MEQAVPGILYTDTRLQFAATDTAATVLVVSEYSIQLFIEAKYQLLTLHEVPARLLLVSTLFKDNAY